MRPEDRLEVLKEMGGASACDWFAVGCSKAHFWQLADVYETKRNESIKELEKTEKQRAEIEVNDASY